MTSAFDSPCEVLNWAREGIEELKSSCRAFLDAQNYKEVRQLDADSGEEILKVVRVGKKMPVSIPRKATETLSNTRNTFDQALFAACCAIGKRPRESIGFPWAQTPDDLEHRLGAKNTKPGKIPKIPPEFWPVLRTFEPYPRSKSYSGGNNLIRLLAQIANRKHTIKLGFSSAISRLDLEIDVEVLTVGQSYESLSRAVWDMVKDEIVIARYAPGSKTDTKYSLQMYVALNEAPPLQGMPIIEGLSVFAAKAQSVIEGLAGAVAGILAK